MPPIHYFFSAAFLLVSSLSASPVFPATADELVAGARKEGVLELYASSTLGPGGSQALTAAFNKKHGLNIRVNYHPSGNMTRDIGKIVGLAASGVAPEWDLMVVTDAHHGSLWTRKLHLPFDSKTLGVDGSAIQYDGGTASVANQMIPSAYNKKPMPARSSSRNTVDTQRSIDEPWRVKAPQ